MDRKKEMRCAAIRWLLVLRSLVRVRSWYVVRATCDESLLVPALEHGPLARSGKVSRAGDA